MGLEPDGSILWRVHLRSDPAEVYAVLATDEGRARFWAESAEEGDEEVHFVFGNGQTLRGRILERRPGELFSVTYFGGSRVTFRLRDDGVGGTDLELRETGFAPDELLANLPGWVSVLMNLKAVVDFGVDLRNVDPERRWEHSYVDV